MSVAVLLVLTADVLCSVCVIVILFGRLISDFNTFLVVKLLTNHKIRCKTKDFTPRNISGVKMLINK